MTTGPTIEVEGRALPVWPEGQPVWSLDEQRTILITRFGDCDHYHPAFQAALDARLAAAGAGEQRARGPGRHQALPPGALGGAGGPPAQRPRAHLFSHALGDRPGGQRRGRHRHGLGQRLWPGRLHRRPRPLRAQASLVYLFDEGDADPEDRFSGLFSFIDPRLALCCQLEPGILSHPTYPTLRRGSMIIFPSQLVHGVNPYGGTRPRISLAWNINREALAGVTLTLLNQSEPRTKP